MTLLLLERRKTIILAKSPPPPVSSVNRKRRNSTNFHNISLSSSHPIYIIDSSLSSYIYTLQKINAKLAKSKKPYYTYLKATKEDVLFNPSGLLCVKW
jgi:hypothetical protein